MKKWGVWHHIDLVEQFASVRSYTLLLQLLYAHILFFFFKDDISLRIPIVCSAVQLFIIFMFKKNHT